MELDQNFKEFLEKNHHHKRDLTIRKINFYLFNNKKIISIKTVIFTYIFNSGALAGKGKWGDKTLDKYLKSPADYAPGKIFLLFVIDLTKNYNCNCI